MKKRFSKKRKISSERRRLVEELHAPARRYFPRRRVIVRGYDDVVSSTLWQANIVEMRPYSGFNRDYHYILIIIDVLSKYAWAISLKSKGGSETANAIVEIIRASERCPKNLQTDMGKEFYNVDVQKILKKHDVNHYSTSTSRISCQITRKHRTIGIRPADVTPAIAERLLDTVYSAIKIAGPSKFKVGDSVCVSKYKTIFEKGYTPNWIPRYRDVYNR
ncbi:PREDICTED: uncharacterized protein LOC108686078 [Atta colombica]|uniref:uncharacterized protein LOC108686078 n=1 Tax=Atta colombica TaxID=520822 RepID=UPI00084C6970|nr:PREDICTED: uncharacterized protein LOC108686078 [Atta colombica]